jgi:hypothetical protein
LYSELTAVAAFIYYFLFLTVLGAAIAGLFNISRLEKARQYSRPEVERSTTATKKEPRLFMVVPKTKRAAHAKKAAKSSAPSTENSDAKKSKRYRSGTGSNGGY